MAGELVHELLQSSIRRGIVGLPVLGGERGAPGSTALLRRERRQVDLDQCLAFDRAVASGDDQHRYGKRGVGRQQVSFAGAEFERQYGQPAGIAAGCCQRGPAAPGRGFQLQRWAAHLGGQPRGGGEAGGAGAAEHHMAGEAAAQHAGERGQALAESLRQYRLARRQGRGVAPGADVAAQQRPQFGHGRQRARRQRAVADDVEHAGAHQAVVGQGERRQRRPEQRFAGGGDQVQARPQRAGRLQFSQREVQQIARFVLAAQRQREPFVQLQLHVGQQAAERAAQFGRDAREREAGGAPVLARGAEQG
ncbi:hypothetical protein [Thauera sp. SDU_THAU2]|uniref:hypothetical protein n=1 Tax=Thauera sp. SDU_THAU2 TaxID=3136633 RepID=UPI00311E5BD6